MALTYRTPMEDIVSSFEPAMQSAIANKAAIEYKQMEEANFPIANFYLKAEAKQKLSAAGIYLSPFSAVVHSHPVCKTLENHFLYTVLPNYINNKFFFVGIKNSKINLLKSRNSKLDLIQAVNRYVSSKDKSRYSNDFVVRSSAPIEGLDRHKATLAECTLKDLVPNISRVKAKHLFLHDELHYWREKDLITFLEVIEPEVLLGTVVFPPELLVGAKRSLNPWCYHFEIQDDKLLFFPDGERSEGYEQPLRGGYLLTTNEIKLPNGQVYCVDLLASKFSHHLFSITKGPAVTNIYRSFGRFEAVSFSGLLDLSPLDQPFLPVSFDIVSKLYRYLRSLKKPDHQSAMAKLSQIVQDPTAEEIKFTQEFADLVINCGTVNSLLSVNRLQLFLTRVYRSVLPTFISDKMKSVRELSLDDFVSRLKPYSFTKKLHCVDLTFRLDFSSFWSELQPDRNASVMSDLDSLYNGKKTGVASNLLPNLHQFSTPYIGMTPYREGAGRFSIELPPMADLLKCFVKRVLDALPCNHPSELAIEQIRSVILSNVESSSIVVNWSIVKDSHFQERVLGRVKAVLAKKAAKINVCVKWFLTGPCWRTNVKFIKAFEESPKHSFPNQNLWASVVNELTSSKLKGLSSLEHKESNGDGGALDVTKVKNFGNEGVTPKLTEGILEAFGLEGLGASEVERLLADLKGKVKLSTEGGDSTSLPSDSDVAIEDEIAGSDLESTCCNETLQGKINELIFWNVKTLEGYSIIRSHSSIFEAIAFKIGFDSSKVLERLSFLNFDCDSFDPKSEKSLFSFLKKVASLFRLQLEVITEVSAGTFKVGCLGSQITPPAEHCLTVLVGDDEIKELHLRNLCVVSAISEALGRKECDIMEVLRRPDYQDLAESVMSGQGVKVEDLEHIFRIFSIKAFMSFGDKDAVLNPDGDCCACFKLEDNHLSYLSRKINQVGCVISSGLKDDNAFERGVLMQVETIGSVLNFKAKKSRSNLLADCMHAGSTGVILSELYNERDHLIKSHADLSLSEDVTHKVHAVLGTFGVGKSSLFKRLMSKARGRTFDFVSPRKSLLEEVKRDLNFGKDKKTRNLRGQQNWFFETFEKFLLRVDKLKRGQLVFLDEIQLFPSGYLDLIFHLAQVDFHLIVLGDPCQSDYDNEKDRDILGSITSNVDALLKGCEYKYNVKSYRFLNPNFIGRLPCEFELGQMSKESSPYLIYNDLEQLSYLPFEYNQVILVSSFEEKKIVSSYNPECKHILTFGESTGLNFNYGTILITMISERTGERRWLTALSRFKENVALVNATGYSIEGLNLAYKERFLGRFLTGRARVSDLNSYLPGRPIFREGFDSTIGKDEGIREEKLVGDPWLKSMIDLFQIEDVDEVELQEVVSQVEEFKIHLPRDELEGVRTRWVHKILNKEFREVRMGGLVSDQFTDDYSKQKGGVHLTNAAERFETIYPRHRANDTVTFIMAVKKRLRFSKPHLETSKLNQAKPFGRYLLQEFLKKIPLKQAHNTLMMEQAKQDFFDKKTSKSAATIENHNIRSCRDWLADIVQVFSKSQICTKFDNRFRSAKAAQSIACFQHSVLCRFAPYMRYIEKKLHEALPARYYIHSGKSLEQLNDWVLKGQFNGLCTESDYEAFDASQDQYIVAFELELMKYLGLPNDLIQDYIYIKTHLGSKLGGFAIMRFTGEASTFLFNTLANMLFTFLRYDIKGNEFICFAGDDMCSSKRLVVKKEHDGFLKKIKLKAKVQHTLKPTFCGWHLSPDGIYKKPQLVFERMCIAKETNNLHNCIDSYAIEVSYAYKMGEKVTQKMDEEEISAYYNCVRTIIKHKHLLKSDVKALYESLE